MSDTDAKWRERWTDIFVGLVALVVVGALMHTGPGPANDTSRLAAAQALVEQGSFVIDETHFAYTADRIQVDGHFYSDKPPLLNLYLAGLYWGVSSVTGWNFSTDMGSLYWWLSLLSSGLGFALSAVALWRLARLLGASRVWAVGTSVAAVGGTLLLPYATVLSSHAVGAGLLAWFALFLFGAAEAEGEPPGPGWGLGVGLLGGLAVLVEPLTAAFVVPMTLAFASLDGHRGSFKWLVGGGALPLIPHAVVCWQIAGNPLLLNVDPAAFDYEGSMHSKENLSGIGWAHESVGGFLQYAYHSLIGYRGAIIYNAPAALGGLAVASRLGGEEGRDRLFAAIAIGVVLFFGLTIGFSDNYSGWAYGVRWHATPAPLLAVCVAVWLGGSAGRLRRIGRVGLVVCGVVGLSLATLGTIDPWTPSTQEEYSFVEVVSGEEVYVKSNLDTAVAHFRNERYPEARYQAGHVLRRNDDVPVAWEIAIVSSARLGDRERLRRYGERLAAGEGPVEQRHRRVLQAKAEKLNEQLSNR